MRFVSIGGWCGTTISLRANDMYGESLPFDHIRSTFDGIIDCIKNNFLNFFPKRIELDNFPNYSHRSYRGKYFGFYYHDLKNSEVINIFNRRIQRFNNILENSKKIIFIRTITTDDYNDELNLTDSFINSIKDKYPSLEFLLIFIIPGQDKTLFYKKLNEKTFIFTLNDNSLDINNLGLEYEPIYNFLKVNDLFKINPKDNVINIKNGYSRFTKVEGVPITRSDN